MSTTTEAATKHRTHSGSNAQSLSKTEAAIEFAQQAEKLGLYAIHQESDATGSTQAVSASFITPQDPVVELADGGRLPAVPVEEAIKLNKLRNAVESRTSFRDEPLESKARIAKDGTVHGFLSKEGTENGEGKSDAPLGDAKAPWKTNPLFPPLPMYGPPTLMRNVHCWTFRISSAILSFLFLLVIILGAAFTSIPGWLERLWFYGTLRNPDKRRPFHNEEVKRRKARRIEEKAWQKQQKAPEKKLVSNDEKVKGADEFVPLEGGPDPLQCDIRLYARRVGLDCEVFDVQTEDGFIIELWHLYNPRTYERTKDSHRAPHSPEIFPQNASENKTDSKLPSDDKHYPVLMIHGLLQSAGAYCTNDDDSLAFFLAKSGYDVWLGNNRCGFKPRHTMLDYSDPRMWSWNIRQMGVMDLPALISRVVSETGFEKLGLVAHSQGTTQTLVALAKEQRPEIGEKISVFCALAPAAYAGPLIKKAQFKFMSIISPAMFRAVFGIHAFIPFMMTMHSLLPGKFYGDMGYRVFAFLFSWSDERWERDLRDRMFQFAPVYVSAESMRWWLGRECFAKQKCILATSEEKTMEDKEDEEEDDNATASQKNEDRSDDERSDEPHAGTKLLAHNKGGKQRRDSSTGRFAWYGPQTPPFALWICGADDLVDGRRLLRRFDRGREPFVDVVHAKIIEGYEHLDVIWAMDAIEKVGKEVREVLWKTAPAEARSVCKVPRGCEQISDVDFYKARRDERESTTRELDATAGEWSDKGAEQVGGGGGEGNRDLDAEMKHNTENLLSEQ